MYTIGKEQEFYDFGIKMMEEPERFKTFTSWVFDDSKPCNAAKLAEAGFYFVGTSDEPDCVQCFLCSKSLDGWEETDDPWEEHLSHAPYCEFAKLKKPSQELTISQSLSMAQEIHGNCISKIYSEKEKYHLSLRKTILQQIDSLKK